MPIVTHFCGLSLKNSEKSMVRFHLQFKSKVVIIILAYKECARDKLNDHTATIRLETVLKLG